MLISNRLKKITLASLLMATTVMAQTPYDEGQKALREGNWNEAIEQFQIAINGDSDNSDASRYWRAHALYKAGRDKEAGRELRDLLRRQPEGRWSKEARMLLIEHQDSEESLVQSAQGDSVMDEELRMYALAQLMDRDAERAIPLLLDIVRNSGSEKVRKDALFVLAMSDEAAAQTAIGEFARDNSHPEMQALAINILGVSASKSALAELARLYNETDDPKVKQAVIHAHIVSDESAFLLEVLRTESNPRLQIQIIHALGAMDATSELRTLYPTLNDRKSKIAAIEAFSIAGDSASLSQIVASESDAELRSTAIRGLAIADDGNAAGQLESIYDSASDKSVKIAVLEALVILDDGKDIALKAVRTETDPELRSMAINILGVMDATEELGDLYASIPDVETRTQVLRSLAISDGSDSLIKVLETEQDEQLRAVAIQSLAISDEAAAAKHLVGLYPNASVVEKKAIIQSMMIMDDAEGLIALMKQEADPELKREMLQMLTVMDSEESNAYLFEMLEQDK